MSITSKELKRRARSALEGNYFPATNMTVTLTLFTLLMSYLLQKSGFAASPKPVNQVFFWVLWVIMTLLGALLEVGLIKFLYILSRKETIQEPGIMFYAFKHQPDTFILTYMFRYLIVWIWFVPAVIRYMQIPVLVDLKELPAALLPVLLLCLTGAVPAVLAALPYCLTTYVLLDNPDASPAEALRQSRTLMQGSKKRLFTIWLSFLPLFLVGLGTYGLGFLWIRPYYHTTMNQFYLSLSCREETILEN